jgi:hypothetical protein
MRKLPVLTAQKVSQCDYLDARPRGERGQRRGYLPDGMGYSTNWLLAFDVCLFLLFNLARQASTPFHVCNAG